MRYSPAQPVKSYCLVQRPKKKPEKLRHKKSSFLGPQLSRMYTNNEFI
jgi:hypothetical protein